MMNDRLISLNAAKDYIDSQKGRPFIGCTVGEAMKIMLDEVPSAQPEYEPVKAEDFAKTMSENTIYSFMAWHGEALELMEKQGFVICKKTI